MALLRIGLNNVLWDKPLYLTKLDLDIYYFRNEKLLFLLKYYHDTFIKSAYRSQFQNWGRSLFNLALSNYYHVLLNGPSTVLFSYRSLLSILISVSYVRFYLSILLILFHLAGSCKFFLLFTVISYKILYE